MLRLGSHVARVEIHVQAEDGLHALEVGLEPGQEKRIRVDGAPLAPGIDPPRPLVSVFLPDRLDLVKGPPAGRRAHLDRVVAALWPARAGTRSSYSRALAQRNALIGRVRAGVANEAQLDAWDRELARHGAALMQDRAAAADLVAPAYTDRAGAVERLTGQFARLSEALGLDGAASLAYRPRSRATTASELAAELQERLESDLERGFTGHGPHRDDLVAHRDGHDLRSYGSQGQQRLALLALLLAEREAIATMRHSPPLMLLDDVMSELDLARRERLAELVAADGQTLISATEADHVPGASSAAVFSVAAGTVTPAASDALA